MTKRKPPNASWESWIDQAIEEGRQAGAFDNLPGTGRPIAGLDRPRDEDWWVKQKLRDEGVSFLPPTLALRKEVEDARAKMAAARSEAEVRQLVEEINTRIRTVNRMATSGPPSNLMPLDADRAVARWREGREGREGRDDAGVGASSEAQGHSGRKDDPAQ